MNKIGVCIFPCVVEYEYRLFGVFLMRSMTIVTAVKFRDDKELKKAVEEKTGRKVVRIISHA